MGRLTGNGAACLPTTPPRVALLNMPSPTSAAATTPTGHAKNHSLVVRGRRGYANRYSAFLRPARLLQLLCRPQLCEQQTTATTTTVNYSATSPRRKQHLAAREMPRSLLAKPISAFSSSGRSQRKFNANLASRFLTPASCAWLVLLLDCALLFLLTQKPLQQITAVASESRAPPPSPFYHMRVLHRKPRHHQNVALDNEVLHHKQRSRQQHQSLNELDDDDSTTFSNSRRPSTRVESEVDAAAQLDHPVRETNNQLKKMTTKQKQPRRRTKLPPPPHQVQQKQQQHREHVVAQTSFANHRHSNTRPLMPTLSSPKNSQHGRLGLNLLAREHNKFKPAYEIGGGILRRRVERLDDDDDEHLDIPALGDIDDDDEDDDVDEDNDEQEEDDEDDEEDEEQDDDDDDELNNSAAEDDEEVDIYKPVGYQQHHFKAPRQHYYGPHTFEQHSRDSPGATAAKRKGHSSIELRHHHQNNQHRYLGHHPPRRQLELNQRVEGQQQLINNNNQQQQQREAPGGESPRVPYQTPVVVSISDNSFVSASPMVATTTTTTTTTPTTTTSKTLTAANSSKAPGAYFNYTYWLEPVEDLLVSRKLAPTTSTTATTTSSHLNQRRRQQQQLEGHSFNGNTGGGATIEDDNWLVVLDDDKGAQEPVVFSEYNNSPVISDDTSSRRTLRQEDEVTTTRSSSSSSSSNEQTIVAPSQASTNFEAASSTITTTMQSSNLSDGLNEEGGASIEDIDLDEEEEDSVGEGDAADEATANELDLDLDLEFVGVKSGGQAPTRKRLQLKRQQQFNEATIGGRRWRPAEVNYANLIVNPPNELPAFGQRRRHWHSAGIQMVQEDPNEFQEQGGLTSAIIAILFGIGATGVLVMIVGAKMRSIRARLAHKGRRRSLVPDTDFLIKTIPI